MDKLPLPEHPRIVAMQLLNGISIMGQLPPGSNMLERFLCQTDQDTWLQPNDVVLLRHPWVFQLRPGGKPGEIQVGWAPLVIIEHCDDKLPKPFLRSQILTMYEPSDRRLLEDYNKHITPLGLQLVPSLEAVGIKGLSTSPIR